MTTESPIVVLKVNQLGDNVIFLPVVQQLVRLLGSGNLHLYTSSLAAPLYAGLLPDAQIHCRNSLQFNRSWRTPPCLFREMVALRRLRPASILVASDQGNVARMLAGLSGAPVRFGSRGPHRPANFFLTHLREELVGESVTLVDWRNARRFMEVLHSDVEAWPDEVPVPDWSHLSDMPEVGANGAVVIHAGASRKDKRWPAERFVDLANELVGHHPVRWIRMGWAEEQWLAADIKLVDTPTVHDLIRSVAGARCLVGNHSAPMHLASSLGVPGVIFAGNASAEWDPYWHPDRLQLFRAPSSAGVCDPSCANAEVTVHQALEAVMAQLEFPVSRGASAGSS